MCIGILTNKLSNLVIVILRISLVDFQRLFLGDYLSFNPCILFLLIRHFFKMCVVCIFLNKILRGLILFFLLVIAFLGVI